MTIPDGDVKTIRVGSAEARPGELVYGWFDVTELPTGGLERLPVIIAQGREAGPTFWFTANIHGDELNGLAALHDIMQPGIVDNLRGTIVAIPSLNPAGLRTGKREPYLDFNDPNRTFPGYVRPDADPTRQEREQKYPTIYEDTMGRLFEVIKGTADFLIDLHTYGLQASCFTIRDRVLYHTEAEEAASYELYRRTDELCKAFGLAVVNESPARHYVESRLHRSTSGAALNEARIPSFTVELGLTGGVDPQVVAAARTGILNSLKWAEMLPGQPEPITNVPVPKVDYNTRRENEPRATVSGILRYRVEPGDLVKQGDVIAVMTDLFGRPLPDGEIRAKNDGWIISLSRGAICYQGQSITNMAIRDEAPMIEPFPE